MAASLHSEDYDRHVWRDQSRVAKPAKAIRQLTLRAALTGCLLIGFVLSAMVVATFVSEQNNAYRASMLEREVNLRLRSVELNFARSLNANWEQLNRLEQILPAMNDSERRAALDAIVGSGTRVGWVGFASTDGIVRSASGGLLEGMDISARAWFREGLVRNHAGDVHDAVLLGKLLDKSSRTPKRFIDFSRPMQDAQGEVLGVLGMHLNYDWIVKYLTESASVLGMDIYLVNETGKVVLSTDGLRYGDLDLASIRMAATGIAGSQLETWPDHQTYFTSVLPRLDYGNLPSFGWRIVGRIAPEEGIAENTSLINEIKLVVGLGLLLGLIAIVFYRVFIVPIEKLAQSAMRIAEGHDEYPFEGNQTREISRLSAALAVLQGRHDNRAPAAKPNTF